MFTGIVEEIGIVRRVGGDLLGIAAQKVVGGLALGDSMAVNGVCLTVVEFSSSAFAVEVMPETLRRTNLGGLRVSGRVNLERALQPSSRLGGHFVQGHVDGTGRLVGKRPEGGAILVRIEAEPRVMRYVVEKGFIAVDGVSLTVFEVGEREFTVSLVGFTQKNIVLPERRPGDLVNLEVDILGKYVERLLNLSAGTSTRAMGQPGGISETLLAENGFV